MRSRSVCVSTYHAVEHFYPDAARSRRPATRFLRATDRLRELGIDPKRTILLGHSLGSYVASEMGRMLGGVKELVALDPAYPGSFNSDIPAYDIDGNQPGTQLPIYFGETANNSIVFVVSDAEGGLAGDNNQAGTAHRSYIVRFSGYTGNDKATDYHNAVVNVFSNLMSRKLTFPSLQQNWYDNNGKVKNSIGFYWHQGVVSANLTNGTNITGLEYVDSSGTR
jgi:pimeloyl-ACP methyl ester carboxylesterase